MAGKLYIAGHGGLLGRALMAQLRERGEFTPLVTRSRAELDLTDAPRVRAFLAAERPDAVVLAAARVGGIRDNAERPADYLRENLLIQTAVIDGALRAGVKRLLFFASNCAYPRDGRQPMREEDLGLGPLEPTSEAYATAKLAGLAMCRACNRQHGVRYLTLVPATLYGPGDHLDPARGHVLTALLGKFLAARAGRERGERARVEVWGSGAPLREFLHAEDLAAACLLLLSLSDAAIDAASAGVGWVLNAGSGEERSIRELADEIAEALGGGFEIAFDPLKPDGAARKLLDSSRLRRLGWSPRIALAEGLRNHAAWVEGQLAHSV